MLRVIQLLVIITSKTDIYEGILHVGLRVGNCICPSFILLRF